MDKKILFVIVLVISAVFVFSIDSFADESEDESIPASAYVAYMNPYYFSDFGFGVYSLDYLGVSKKPYLTEGLNDDSDLDEIVRAYNKANEHLSQKVILQEDDRVMFITVTITDASDINIPPKVFTLSSFIPSDEKTKFTFSSLPSKDKESFYKDVLSKYLNPGKDPTPFDGKIEFFSSDGSIIQTWDYENCEITDYSIYLKNDNGILNYIKFFGSEIRDDVTVECVGFRFNPQVKLNYIEDIPDAIPVTTEDRATSIVVNLVDSVDKEPFTSYSISKFEPLWFEGVGQGHFGKYSVGFALESLPSKDKVDYYELISLHINRGVKVVPFDMTIDILTGDKQILQSWIYKNCLVENYTPSLLEFLMIYKYHPGFESEIIDRTEFTCQGLSFDGELKPAPQEAKNLAGQPIPDDERAFFYVVHLIDAPDIPSPNTSIGFSSFSYITDPTLSRISGVTSDNPIGSSVDFFLEGMSGKDKAPVYEIISKYVNPGKRPEPFDVHIDLVTRDGYTLQTWKNIDCVVTDYNIYYDETLTRYKFVRDFILESRDAIWFSCEGYSVDVELRDTTKQYSSIPLIPLTDGDRVRSYVVHLTDAPDDFIQAPQTFYTFSKFEPFRLSKSEVTPVGYSQYLYGFLIEGLTSSEHQAFYEIASRYTTAEKVPEPFDMTVEVLTGDAHTVQTWEYKKMRAWLL